MKKLLLLLLLFIHINCWAPPATLNIKEDNEKYENKCKAEYQELYKSSISKLIEFEGYSEFPYIDSHGKSIGYGHFLVEGEELTSISKNDAYLLLIKDYEQAITTVETATNFNRYYDTKKVLALAHFVYNFGQDAFLKSTLLKCIQNGEPIDTEIMRWTKAKMNGNIVVVPHLKMRRSYELALYNES